MSFVLGGVLWNDDGSLATNFNVVKDGPVGYTLEKYMEAVSAVEDALQVLAIIKKYTTSGGWSGDYTTRYWEMTEKEIKIIDEFFKDVPVQPLSE